MKEKIIVIGGGGHAKVLISILKKLDKYFIIGYTDIKNKGLILGVEYIGTDDILENLFKKADVRFVAIGIGQIRNLEFRSSIIDKIKGIGFVLPAIVSTNSIINEDVKIGEGTVIMDGVIINSGTNIGKYSIINTKTSIDHDCEIGDFVHLAPGVTVCGDVIIGNKTFVGAGSTIVNNIEIKDNQFIKANSLCK